MHLKEDTLYVSGLFDMASSVSNHIGPSAFSTICFNKDNYIEDFKKFYNIKKDFELIDSKLFFDELLAVLFGNDKKIISGFNYYLINEIGNPNKILTMKIKDLELLESSSRGYGAFYTVEDVYFIETDKEVLSIILGNNE